MRARPPGADTGVPADWHPHQLRDTPADADPERDAAVAKHSAVGMIDAIIASASGQ